MEHTTFAFPPLLTFTPQGGASSVATVLAQEFRQLAESVAAERRRLGAGSMHSPLSHATPGPSSSSGPFEAAAATANTESEVSAVTTFMQQLPGCSSSRAVYPWMGPACFSSMTTERAKQPGKHGTTVSVIASGLGPANSEQLGQGHRQASPRQREAPQGT
eukprot:1156227-Pelagomonas_calceolata.AAC.1